VFFRNEITDIQGISRKYENLEIFHANIGCPQMNEPLVAVLVLNWNGKEFTLACLESLQRLSYSNTKLIVIDNGSTDGSVEAVSKSFPDIDVIQSESNLGYVGGNNLGISMAQKIGAEYVLLINNDTVVDQHFLSILVHAAETENQVAALGPTIYYYDAPNMVWSAGGEIDWRSGQARLIGLDEEDSDQFGTVPRAVDFLTGCALFVKTAVINEIGPLDSRFFAYYEETEWCVRMVRAGYRIYHVPLAKVWHKIKVRDREISPTAHYYMTRNRLLFLQSVQASWQAWLHTLVLEYLRTLMSWSIRPKWHDMRQQRNIMVRAIIDFFRGRTGKLDLS
jgi:GT2 family glycosyltransferase